MMSPDRIRPGNYETKGSGLRRRVTNTAAALIVGFGGIGSVSACNSSSSGAGEISVDQLITEVANSAMIDDQPLEVQITSGQIFPTVQTSIPIQGNNYAIDSIRRYKEDRDYVVTFIPAKKQKNMLRRLKQRKSAILKGIYTNMQNWGEGFKIQNVIFPR